MFTRSSGVAPVGLHTPCRAEDNSKNRDYVYLALTSGQRNASVNSEAGPPNLFGCALSSVHCLENRPGGGQDRGVNSPLRRWLLLISASLNVCLLLALIILIVAYLRPFINGSGSSQTLPLSRGKLNKSSNDIPATIKNGTCMISHFCSDALWEQHQDHFYWFSWHHVTWAQARQQCHHLGADLVSIKNQKENDFLSRRMMSKFRPGSRPNGFYFWIGLVRDITASDQIFQWVDGSEMGFTEWSLGQPDNEGGLEHCGQSSLSPGNRGGWADRRCWTIQPFVCKRPVGHHRQ